MLNLVMLLPRIIDSIRQILICNCKESIYFYQRIIKIIII